MTELDETKLQGVVLTTVVHTKGGSCCKLGLAETKLTQQTYYTTCTEEKNSCCTKWISLLRTARMLESKKAVGFSG